MNTFLPEILAALMAMSLTIYALSGGADFGGGVWNLFTTGRRSAAQQKLIADAIAPIWEANHVWLIFVIVLLFTGFAPAFAAISTYLHIPLTLMLIGIVFRGGAFAFRTYAPSEKGGQRWGRVFAIASTLTPLLLGVTLGAISSGRMDPNHLDFVAPWFHPFGLSVGLFAVILFAFLAAVYLTVEAEGNSELQEDFRTRALLSGIVAGPVAFLVWILSRDGAPYIWRHLSFTWWTWPLQIVTAITALTCLATLWLRKFHVAVFAARLQVTLILWGWVFAQYPYLALPAWTISGSAAPEVTLRLLLYGVLGGAILLAPSLYYLLRVFKSRKAGA